MLNPSPLRARRPPHHADLDAVPRGDALSTGFAPTDAATDAAAAAGAATLRRTPPAVTETTINGWRVLLQPVATTEIVALSAFLPTGGAADPHHLAGRTSLALNLLQKGTTRHSALAWAEAVEDLGSEIGGSVTSDFTKWSLVSVASSLEPTLDLWTEAFYEPAFDADEVAKERDLLLAELRMEQDSTFSVTYRAFREAMFAGTPYQEQSGGSLASAPNLEREHLVARHNDLARGAGGLIVASGGFAPDQLVRWLSARLRPTVGPVPTPAQVTAPIRSGIALHTIRKQFEQGFLCVGGPTVPMTDPSYPAVRVLAALLGEGMGSRLFVKLRDEKGLAYATGASSAAARAVGHLFCYIGTMPERMAESRDGMLAIFDELRATPPTADEMLRARNVIAGRFLFDHQKMSRQTFYLGFFEMLGGSWRDDAEFTGRIEAVTAEQVQQAAERFLAAPLVTELLPPASD
jgi:predicted Zn-dependent peptidase